MERDPTPMSQKIREILFRYRATPLEDGVSPAERYLGCTLSTKLDALKPIKMQRTILSTRPVRSLKVGERVQALY